ncbi:PQQ-binding-like beta-propeller repeat protein [Pedosphaera parvula]|uniref:Pyrrolo-quinoline quinone n=1 Tax=Pedosphaera parvula (strain Ellin514) TaxID=320771 RepID=B9XSV3_PEDPL|nr:PQQ-binding-like beta-propeller repeat protein [Pedosphaera parvula]EEF57090.1 pyrrolo-quinoline quinone [Pedosphaera parvula Ellin514]
MPTENMVFVGIKGTAIALDRSTGDTLWQTHLAGSGYVHLVLDGENLYATTQGEVFCLDPATGDARWHNGLKGYGLGLASLVTRKGLDGGGAILMAEELQREEQQRQQQAHAATVAST